MKHTMMISWMAAAVVAAAAWANVTNMPEETHGQTSDLPDVVVTAEEPMFTQHGDIPDLVVIAEQDGRTTAYTTRPGDNPLPDIVVIAQREGESLAASGNASETPAL